MSKEIQRALASLDSGHASDGLAALLRAWRQVRDPGLAEVVRELDSILQQGLGPLPTGRNRQAEWQTRLAAGVDHRRLLEDHLDAPAGRQRKQTRLLRTVAPDPRWYDAIEQLGPDRLNPFALARLAESAGDPRFRELLEAQATREETQESPDLGLIQSLRRAAEALPTPTEIDTRAVVEGIARWRERGDLDGGVAGAALIEKLRDEAYARASVESTAVLADALCEQAEPTGRFLQLDLRADELDHAGRAERDALRRRLEAQLLGPLAAVVHGPTATFRRGLLAEARLELRTKQQRAQFHDHPMLHALERVHTHPQHLQSPALARVRHLGMRLQPAIEGRVVFGDGRWRHHKDAPSNGIALLPQLAKGNAPKALQSVCVKLPNRELTDRDHAALSSALDLHTLHCVEGAGVNQRDVAEERWVRVFDHDWIRARPRVVVDCPDSSLGPRMLTLRRLWELAGRGANRDLVVISETEWVFWVRGGEGGLRVVLSGTPTSYDPAGYLRRWIPAPGAFDQLTLQTYLTPDQRGAVEDALRG